MNLKTLRSLHLYLGCFFAPLILFFTVSGIWQTLEFYGGTEDSENPSLLAYLSTIHTGGAFKSSGLSTLSSPYLHWLILLMAVSLIFTIILGLIMAFRFGHKRVALSSLAAGLLIPATCVVYAVIHHP